MGNGNQVRTASGLNILAGLWLVIAPFVLVYATTAGVWNSVIVGLLVAILAGIRAFRPGSPAWMSWANVVLGFWVIIAPFIFAYATFDARLWNNIIVGIIIAALGAWSAMSTSRGEPTGRGRVTR